MRHLFVPLLLALVACKSESTAKPEATPLAPAPAPGHAAGPAGGDVRSASSGLMPQQVAPHALEKLADGRVALGPFSLQVPAGWQEKPSTSSMRAAQFELPASSGTAELIVYYFGESGAGTVRDNIDRWLDQFKQEDGKSSRDAAQIEQIQVAGQDTSLVSVSGRYVAAAMPGGEPQDKPNQSLLAAIVTSPHGPYYFRLIGDAAAVSAHTAEFRQLLASLKLR
jgi:hypothetical protein